MGATDALVNAMQQMSLRFPLGKYWPAPKEIKILFPCALLLPSVINGEMHKLRAKRMQNLWRLGLAKTQKEALVGGEVLSRFRHSQ